MILSFNRAMHSILMMNSVELRSLKETGLPFSGVFMLRGCSRKVAKNGRPYLAVEVGDRFGSFFFNAYEDSAIFGLLNNAELGIFLQVDGISDFYNDRFSPRIQTVRRLTSREIHDRGLEKQLLDGPKESLEALRKELQSFIDRIQHSQLRQTVLNALEEVGEAFWISTAAISMHHAYRHGLLEHSLHVTRAGAALLPFYPFIDADLALTGMILHDVGKVLEYAGDRAFERTRAGLLEGHVVLGYRIVRKAGIQAGLDDDILLQLEHIILSHQGLLEYGAAVLPASPEGVFVSLLDNFDARMNMVERALDITPATQEFSEKILGLDSVRLLTTGK